MILTFKEKQCLQNQFYFLDDNTNDNNFKCMVN